MVAARLLCGYNVFFCQCRYSPVKHLMYPANVTLRNGLYIFNPVKNREIPVKFPKNTAKFLKNTVKKRKNTVNTLTILKKRIQPYKLHTLPQKTTSQLQHRLLP